MKKLQFGESQPNFQYMAEGQQQFWPMGLGENPYYQNLGMKNVFFNAFGYTGSVLPKEKSKRSKKSSKIDSDQKVPHILPSIIKVGGDSTSNLGSGVKSSTTFLSSPLGKIRRSK